MLFVRGSLHAEGTAQDSIIFTRYQDEYLRRWGGIYLAPTSENNIISHAKIEHCIFIWFSNYGSFFGGGLAIGSNNNKISNIEIENLENGIFVLSDISAFLYKIHVKGTNEPIPACQIKVAGYLPEWSDSLGYFEYKLPPASYTMQVMHPWFENTSVSNVSTVVGEDTDIVIYMDNLWVDNADEETVSTPKLQINNYPNPFNPSTTISFSLPQKEDVSVKVYNIRGQLVRSLVDENMLAGKHNIMWHGKDSSGKKVGSGVYFYKIKTKTKSRVGKMLLLK